MTAPGVQHLGIDMGTSMTEVWGIWPDGSLKPAQGINKDVHSFPTTIMITEAAIAMMKRKFPDTATITLKEIETVPGLIAELISECVFNLTSDDLANKEASDVFCQLFKCYLGGYDPPAVAKVDATRHKWTVVYRVDGDKLGVSVGVLLALFFHQCALKAFESDTHGSSVSHDLSQIKTVVLAVPNNFDLQSRSLYERAAKAAGLSGAKIYLERESVAATRGYFILQPPPWDGHQRKVAMLIIDQGAFTTDTSLVVYEKPDHTKTIKQLGFVGDNYGGRELTRGLAECLEPYFEGSLTPDMRFSIAEQVKLRCLGSIAAPGRNTTSYLVSEGSLQKEVTLSLGHLRYQVPASAVKKVFTDHALAQSKAIIKLVKRHFDHRPIKWIVFTGSAFRSYLMRDALQEILYKEQITESRQCSADLDVNNNMVIKGLLLDKAYYPAGTDTNFKYNGNPIMWDRVADIQVDNLPYPLSWWVKAGRQRWHEKTLLKQHALKGDSVSVACGAQTRTDNKFFAMFSMSMEGRKHENAENDRVQGESDANDDAVDKRADGDSNKLLNEAYTIELPMDIFSKKNPPPFMTSLTYTGDNTVHLRFTPFCQWEGCNTLACSASTNELLTCEAHTHKEEASLIQPFETTVDITAFARRPGKDGVLQWLCDIRDRVRAPKDKTNSERAAKERLEGIIERLRQEEVTVDAYEAVVDVCKLFEEFTAIYLVDKGPNTCGEGQDECVGGPAPIRSKSEADAEDGEASNATMLGKARLGSDVTSGRRSRGAAVGSEPASGRPSRGAGAKGAGTSEPASGRQLRGTGAKGPAAGSKAARGRPSQGRGAQKPSTSKAASNRPSQGAGTEGAAAGSKAASGRPSPSAGAKRPSTSNAANDSPSQGASNETGTSQSTGGRAKNGTASTSTNAMVAGGKAFERQLEPAAASGTATTGRQPASAPLPSPSAVAQPQPTALSTTSAPPRHLVPAAPSSTTGAPTRPQQPSSAASSTTGAQPRPQQSSSASSTTSAHARAQQASSAASSTTGAQPRPQQPSSAAPPSAGVQPRPQQPSSAAPLSAGVQPRPPATAAASSTSGAQPRPQQPSLAATPTTGAQPRSLSTTGAQPRPQQPSSAASPLAGIQPQTRQPSSAASSATGVQPRPQQLSSAAPVHDRRPATAPAAISGIVDGGAQPRPQQPSSASSTAGAPPRPLVSAASVISPTTGATLRPQQPSSAPSSTTGAQPWPQQPSSVLSSTTTGAQPWPQQPLLGAPPCSSWKRTYPMLSWFSRDPRASKSKPEGETKQAEVNEVISDSDDDEKTAKKVQSTLKRGAESSSTAAQSAKKMKDMIEE